MASFKRICSYFRYRGRNCYLIQETVIIKAALRNPLDRKSAYLFRYLQNIRFIRGSIKLSEMHQIPGIVDPINYFCRL